MNVPIIPLIDPNFHAFHNDFFSYTYESDDSLVHAVPRTR